MHQDCFLNGFFHQSVINNMQVVFMYEVFKCFKESGSKSPPLLGHALQRCAAVSQNIFFKYQRLLLYTYYLSILFRAFVNYTGKCAFTTI